MALEISEREREGVTVLDLSGRLIVGEPTTQLREKVQALAAAGKSRAVLNLQRVDFIDSSGLGSMVICFTALQKAGGAMKLLNLSRRNVELLVLTKLSTVFETFDSEDDAINSFFPNRQVRRFDLMQFVQEQKERAKEGA